jgi:glycosyltransferase involved in cell wall biosynthesis
MINRLREANRNRLVTAAFRTQFFRLPTEIEFLKFTQLLKNGIDFQEFLRQLKCEKKGELSTLQFIEENNFRRDNLPHIYFNLSASKHWRSNPVGIIRVERELAKHLIEINSKDISFIFYDASASCFKLIPTQLATEILNDSWCDENFKSNVDVEAEIISPNLITKDDILISAGLDWDLSPVYEIGKITSPSRCKVILFCYDTVPIKFPEFCVRNDFDQLFKLHFVNMAHVASRIIAISRNTKKDLMRVFEAAKIEGPLPPVDVINLGSFPVMEQLPELNEIDQDRIRHIKFIEDYALYVSSVESRKNHQILFNIWRDIYQQRGNDSPTLVIVGMAGWGVRDLTDQLQRMPAYIAGKIIWLQNVNDDMLLHLYRLCNFSVFPSLYEGWGLAAAEAMSFGKVCIVSNNSSLNEATQDLMPSYHPLDYFGWKNEIERMFDDEGYRIYLENKIRLSYISRNWLEFVTDFSEKILKGVDIEA